VADRMSGLPVLVEVEIATGKIIGQKYHGPRCGVLHHTLKTGREYQRRSKQEARASKLEPCAHCGGRWK